MTLDPPTITAGQQILHYRLTEKLGEGGMGVVWKASDTTLDRFVAIKVLPPGFSADPERLARFEREAKLLASLNHPNIATVYSVHTVEGVRYLTMELVPGEDLAQRIARGPVPVAEAIEIARQIALALEAAHESGVVHRDLKPANVRLTPDGRVKVLDFGLAKALESTGSTPILSQSPTLVATAMGSSMIIGTAAYMSPEQARGQKVDRRADVWAFGVVLYEMLTGRRAFEGDTVSDVLAAVLRAEPERSHVPADLPRPVRTMLDRCLQKNPHRRLRDIGEALLVLEDVQAGRVDSAEEMRPAPVAKSNRRRFVWEIVGVVAAVVATTFATAMFKAKPHESPTRKLTLALHEESGEVLAPVVSPDGRRIAYLHQRKLWVRDLGQLTSRMLAEGLDEDFRPVWSPDGASVAFGTATGIARVDVASGAIAPVCGVSDFSGGSGGSWMPDGHLLFAKGSDHIYTVAAAGGVPSVHLARVDSLEIDLHHPHVLPGDRGLIYVRHLAQGGPRTLALAHGDERKTLLELPSGFIWEPVYDPRGYILYSRVGEGAGLWALPFSLARLESTGEPFLIAPEGAAPSIAADGSLVYRLGTTIVESQVVLMDGSGAVVDRLTDVQRGFWHLALSPDGRKLAAEVRESGDADVWLWDLDRKGQTRFAFGSGRQLGPGWSPDGRRVVYEEQGRGLFVKPADGSAAAQFLVPGFQPAITADGRHLIYSTNGTEGGPDIWYVTLDGPRDTLALIVSPATELRPTPAPQGGFLLYTSDESGREEIYLRQFPAGTGRWQVSTNGAAIAVWSRRGDRIYYWDSDEVYEVPVQLVPEVQLGAPRLKFNLGELKLQSWGRNIVLPTSNPDRFLALGLAEQTTESAADAILVQNWTAEFAKPK